MASKRSDVETNSNGWRKLSYTARCGWIDWGHALPGNANRLKNIIDAEKSDLFGLRKIKIFYENKPAFVFQHNMTMGYKFIKFGPSGLWVVRKGLSAKEKENVALGLYLLASHSFESFQGGFPFNLVSSSSYSGEDLVSNLIGFYQAYRGLSEVAARLACGETSVEESLRIWDTHTPGGLGNMKNYNLKPIQFPIEQKNKDGSIMETSFPMRFDTIKPTSAGELWRKLDNLPPRPHPGIPSNKFELRIKLDGTSSLDKINR